MDADPARRPWDLRGQRTGPERRRNAGATEPSPDRDRGAGAPTPYVTSVSIASGPEPSGNDWDSWDEQALYRTITVFADSDRAHPQPTRRQALRPSSGPRGARRRPGHRRHPAVSRHDYDDYADYDDGPVENYDDYDSLENYDDDEARIDRRWMWIAGVAGAILFVAVITASLILGGGDSGSVSATIASPEPTSSAAPEPSSAPRRRHPRHRPCLPRRSPRSARHPPRRPRRRRPSPPLPCCPPRRPPHLPQRPPAPSPTGSPAAASSSTW